ncbi:MAG: hypothetical protein Q9P01_15305 [Anaerolineae bacterium]|nr:hypothetical protein [Anaerolineae bacterium]MDQ7036143.1 hypothetical protein [Anaerolineae bacterium]
MDKSKDKSSQKLAARSVAYALTIPIVFFATLIGLSVMFVLGRNIYTDISGGNVNLFTVTMQAFLFSILGFSLVKMQSLANRDKHIWRTLATRWQDKRREDQRIEPLLQRHHETTTEDDFVAVRVQDDRQSSQTEDEFVAIRVQDDRQSSQKS